MLSSKKWFGSTVYSQFLEADVNRKKIGKDRPFECPLCFSNGSFLVILNGLHVFYYSFFIFYFFIYLYFLPT